MTHALRWHFFQYLACELWPGVGEGAFLLGDHAGTKAGRYA